MHGPTDVKYCNLCSVSPQGKAEPSSEVLLLKESEVSCYKTVLKIGYSYAI